MHEKNLPFPHCSYYRTVRDERLCFAVPPSFTLLFSKKSLARYVTYRDNGSTVRAY